jgi:hypothetical protein
LRKVFESQYYTLVVDDTSRFARIVRTADPFPSLEVVRSANGELLKAVLNIFGLKRVLVDLRSGPPGRNDPEFERATDEVRRTMSTIERVAILLKTQAGRLQALRLSPMGERMQVFLDEDAALDYLNA